MLNSAETVEKKKKNAFNPKDGDSNKKSGVYGRVNAEHSAKKGKESDIRTYGMKDRTDGKANTEDLSDNGIKIDINRGLNSSQIGMMRSKYGSNRLTGKKKNSFISLLAANLGDPIIRILVAALIINVILSFRDFNLAENIGIAAAIIIASTVSAISEYAGEGAFERLNEMSSKHRCTVTRGGRTIEIDEGDIVVGDIVTVTQGSEIPADCIILNGRITVSQAPLTGESRDIFKSDVELLNGKSIVAVCKSFSQLPERKDYIFKGCFCTGGEAVCLVCRVGDSTMLGRIADTLNSDSGESPLKTRLGELAKTVSVLGYIASGLIAAAYLLNTFVIDSGFDPALILLKLSDLKLVASTLIKTVTLAVSVIVVAVPEGLPMMITVVLSSNIKKLLRDGVLVRRPVGIETAGAMNILFCDKTGTLTSGNMKVKCVFSREKSYNSAYEFRNSRYSAMASVIENGLVSKGRKTATEKAIISFFKEIKGRSEAFSAIAEKLVFTSELKYSACTSGGYTYLLGAAEKLLRQSSYFLNEEGKTCKMDSSSMAYYKKIINDEASDCARLLALAVCPESAFGKVKSGCPEDLTFVLLFSVRDTLRPNISITVSQVQRAGVHVVMITGDNRDTAVAVAKEAGIFTDDKNEVIDGSTLSSMKDSELEAVLPHLAVVCRALPNDKLRLIEISKNKGLVSGMTGDGINDAPSLKAADVGFSMGSGSDVAKDASDIVVVNNSFETIARAVLYGRTIFESIRKFIVFQLSMNLCALGVSLICPFVGVDSPITVIQMLWVNIIMDSLGALAFAGEPALGEYMERNPIERKAPILSREMVWQVITNGVCTLALCLVFLKLPFFSLNVGHGDTMYHLTCFFALFIFCGIVEAFNARSPRGRTFANLSKNKAFVFIITLVMIVQLTIVYFGGETFRCTPPDVRDLCICGVLALFLFPADTVRKIFVSLRNGEL